MKLKLKLFAVLAAHLVACAPLAQAECFSDGIRIGTIQKFSRKGTFAKSWEGELVMDGTKIRPGANGGTRGGNVWKFSTLDPAVAKEIDDAVMSGSEVALKYCQVLASFGKTDTDYLITKAVIRK